MRTCVPLLLGVLLLAACGSSSSSDPGSKNYDPAKTTLHKAGLEVCGAATKDVPSSISNIQGLGATRAFYVAKDCNGATTSPNALFVFQFTSVESANSGATTIKASLRNASVIEHYPLVIASLGPDKDANLAAVQAQLPPAPVVTTG